MSARVFLDTNVLVYAFDSSEPRKQQVAWGILEGAGEQRDLVISVQVLQEFFVATTRKLQIPLSEADAELALQRLAELPVVPIDSRLVQAAVAASRRYRLSLWDAVIVQAALAGACTQLLSEDLQPGLAIGTLQISNPFSQ